MRGEWNAVWKVRRVTFVFFLIYDMVVLHGPHDHMYCFLSNPYPSRSRAQSEPYCEEFKSCLMLGALPLPLTTHSAVATAGVDVTHLPIYSYRLVGEHRKDAIIIIFRLQHFCLQNTEQHPYFAKQLRSAIWLRCAPCAHMLCVRYNVSYIFSIFLCILTFVIDFKMVRFSLNAILSICIAVLAAPAEPLRRYVREKEITFPSMTNDDRLRG